MNASSPVVQRDQNQQGSQAPLTTPRRHAGDDAGARRRHFETAGGVTLWADFPGVPRENLDVYVHDSSLRIEGEAVVPTPVGLHVQHAEVRQPRYARSFTLSPDLDASRIEANLQQDGVLKITIPRREEAKPRRIDVSVG